MIKPIMPRPIHQNFVDEDIDPIMTLPIHESILTEELLQPFLKETPRPIGISAAYSESGSRLLMLAIANQTKVLLVEFYSSKPSNAKLDAPVKNRDYTGRNLLQDKLLCRPMGDILAFDLHEIVLALYQDHNMRLANGIDIQSACPVRDRQPITAIKSAAGDTVTIWEDNIRDAFENMTYDSKRMSEVALRAWVSQYLPRLAGMEEVFANAKRIDTHKLAEVTLNLLAKTIRDGQRLDEMKPTQVTRNLTTSYDLKKKQLQANADKYRDKVRKSEHQRQHVVVGTSQAQGYVLESGQIASASGRSANIKFDEDGGGTYLEGKVIGTITTIGRDDPTNAEKQRERLILRVLQGAVELLSDNPWVTKICLLPPDDFSWPASFRSVSTTLPLEPDFTTLQRPLNSSQLRAVKQMLSPTDDSRICLIQGPPGTGKTTVIATYVLLSVSCGQSGIWLTAQSNVAVKNIAEKLCDFGFLDWKLLVSTDFHYEWHEHLYSKITANIIRSDRFGDKKFVRESLNNCKVILCTLSMLSNPRLTPFTMANPLTTLVIDEASQIEVGDYVAVFTRYVFSLRKLCFIGDDKQLPPHGQEEIESLQSIFEVTHLRDSVILLDTQYRMPPQIGDFISHAVYDDKLLSNPEHPITSKTIACYLIDVCEGTEKRDGTSFKNLAECDAVLQIAEHLQNQGQSYRIITPYDSQTKTIEEGMKEKQLNWEDKCFNVDSFQGNEDDYIIISTVRSKELGFLRNKRRTNVMLSRCKRGMFICTNQAFLKGAAATSLVGELAAKFSERGWVERKDLDEVLSKF